jgi:DNA-binding transcriptional regulator GbsR (MarR family)
MASDQPFADRETIVGDEESVYEAIATLEYLGRPVTVTDLTEATGLPQQKVEAAMRGLLDRGIVTRASERSDSDYEPANRGWSAAPEQANGPMR